MLKKKSVRLAIVGAAFVAIVAGAAVVQVANATVQSNGSDAKVYIGDNNSNALVSAGHTFAWVDDTFGFHNSASVTDPYVCPTDATGSTTFISPKGSERTIASWSATGTSLFYPAGSKNVAQFNTSLYGQNGGNVSAVKSAGGDYSIGLACTISNGAALATTGVFFASIHVTASTGAYTVDQPTEDAAPPSGTFSQNLSAQTMATTDGTLNLVSPVASSIAIGSPQLDSLTHLSTSTGALGEFTVQDGRVVSHPGWTLTSTVADFVNGGATINARQLGITPILVSTDTTGALVSAAQVAGSGIYPASFATADGSAAVGNTVLKANLKFVAPSSAAVGTYTSTLTLTLTSR